MKNGKVWVGDRVRDEDTGRDAIVSDVRGGRTYVLRALGGGREWTSENPERLTVTVPLKVEPDDHKARGS
ncbi:hypothetical protein [Streptomyces sp. NPDC021212]|uniref:hypothetical protein n=1 Tax=Streptomyces sp. NPDC021212 TaxID=3365118 RepID=UPI0037948C87